MIDFHSVADNYLNIVHCVVCKFFSLTVKKQNLTQSNVEEVKSLAKVTKGHVLCTAR